MRLKVLTILAIGAGVLSAPVCAQTNNNALSARLDRIERDMQTLSRSVFKGDVPPPSISGGGMDNQQAAQMEVRMNQIEEQLRRLTGMVEENSYRLRQLSEQQANMPVGNNYTNDNPQYQNDAGTSSNTPSQPTPLSNNDTNNDPYQLGTINGNNNGGTMSPAKMYDQAFSYLQTNDYASAQSTFDDFISTYPDHSLAANAKYWLGETYYARGNYQEAARAFARAFKDHPDGQKAPDTLLKLAMSLKGQDMTEEACLTLAELETRFPNAPASVKSKTDEEQQSYACD